MSPELSLLDNWEAHKCTIRGELISMTRNLKRRRVKTRRTLIAKIATLETTQTLSRSRSRQGTTTVREELKTLLDAQIKCNTSLRTQFFYEHGDKTGKYLTKRLNSTTPSSTVHCIKDSRGVSHFSPTAIAVQYCLFYKLLL